MDSASADGPAPLHLAHVAQGRIRLRSPEPLAPEAMDALTERIARLGPRRVVGRPNTGSLIIETDEDSQALLARIAEAGVARIARTPTPPPVRQTAQLGLTMADSAVERRTDGAFDLRSAMAMIFLGAAVYQMTRGRLFGPAATMIGLALSFLEASGKRR